MNQLAVPSQMCTSYQQSECCALAAETVSKLTSVSLAKSAQALPVWIGNLVLEDLDQEMSVISSD
jgi:hypothetical protein